MSNPFRYLDAISHSKEELEVENDYNSFLINRGLSYHIDAIFASNEMNQRPHIDAPLQFSFLLNSLPRRKRFSKWIKPEENQDVEAIMEYFGYSRVRAQEAYQILTENQVAMVREKLNKGGLDNHGRTG